VGLEHEVLVELHVGCGTGLFGVDLRVVELDVRANQLRDGVDRRSGAHGVEVRVRHFDR